MTSAPSHPNAERAAPRGLSPRIGIAALLGAAAIVCAVHGTALDSLTEADLIKAVRQDRFTATQKVRRREPLSDPEKAAMAWRPGQPPPTLGDSWPWYLGGGALAVASALLLLRRGSRDQAPLPGAAHAAPPPPAPAPESR